MMACFMSTVSRRKTQQALLFGPLCIVAKRGSGVENSAEFSRECNKSSVRPSVRPPVRPAGFCRQSLKPRFHRSIVLQSRGVAAAVSALSDCVQVSSRG